MLSIEASISGAVTIRVRDSQSPRRGKPRQAAGVQLYQRIIPRDEEEQLHQRDTLTEDPRWQFIGVFGSTQIQIRPQAGEPGDLICLAARWMTRRGETGPFGQIAATRMSFGGVRNRGMIQERRMVA